MWLKHCIPPLQYIIEDWLWVMVITQQSWLSESVVWQLKPRALNCVQANTVYQADRPLHTTCLVCLHGHFLKTTTWLLFYSTSQPSTDTDSCSCLELDSSKLCLSMLLRSYSSFRSHHCLHMHVYLTAYFHWSCLLCSKKYHEYHSPVTCFCCFSHTDWQTFWVQL